MEKRKRKTLVEIYAGLPKIDCKKKCAASCASIPLSTVELKPLVAKKGPIETQSFLDDKLMLKNGPDGYCQFLIFKECTVYDVRPMICRLYGIVPEMKCPHGCVPERYLDVDEITEIMVAIHALQKPSKARF